MSLARLGVLFLAGPSGPPEPIEPPATRPLVTLRAVHPDRELVALLGLFVGSRAESPAAALAAWKRATADPKRLGKPLEGVVASLNPRMIAEYRNLDDAVIGLRRDPARNEWVWRATIPRDDGTLGAIEATGLLSGGRVGATMPVGTATIRVDHLTAGPYPVLVRSRSALILANDVPQLVAGFLGSVGPLADPGLASGWLVAVDPTLIEDQFPTLLGRRLGVATRATGFAALDARARIEGKALVVQATGRFADAVPELRPVDPAWLDFIPAQGPSAAIAFGVDHRPEAWAKLFDLVDRVERVDPGRAQVAPSRLRLALAARAVGVRLEADVLPHLVGVSGWFGRVGADPVGRGVLALHLDDHDAARRLVAGVRQARDADPNPPIDSLVDLGTIAGRPVRLVRRDRSVGLVWGPDAGADSLTAVADPDRSARRWLLDGRASFAPSRVGAIWVDQLITRPDAADLAASLAEAPPIRWAGGMVAGQTRDEVRLDDLDGSIRRFLERIPFDSPPLD